MAAELKIILDVARYRLGRFEMANLAAAGAIMLTLRLSPTEILVRVGFGWLLNLLVYLNNDWFDLDDDLATTTRDPTKTQYLLFHRDAGLRAQLWLLGGLIAFAWLWGEGLWLPLIGGGGICWAYSSVLKRRPFTDILAMLLWGIMMPAVAVPPNHPEGWWLLGQLGLFSAVFETIQVLRDHPTDHHRGIQTTAVVLGPLATQRLGRGLMVLSGAYAACIFHPALACLPGVAAMGSIPSTRIESYWNQIRILFGATLLAECAIVYFAGGMA